MKINKKHLGTTLIVGVSLCSLMPKTDITATEITDNTQIAFKDYGTTGLASSDTILTVDYGTSCDEVVFDATLNGGNGAGPEAFWVENESSVYILDSLGKKINHYVNKRFTDSTPLIGTMSPQCFAVASNGTIYVCDTYNGESKLLLYDENELSNSFVLDDLIATYDISVDENGFVQLSDWNIVYEYHFSDGILTPLAQTPLDVSKMPENAYTRHLGTDENFRYELQTQLVDSCVLLGEIRVAAVNSEGGLVSSARIPLEDFVYQPNQYIQIDGNGKIYMMVPTSTHLEIRKITLGATSDSRIDEVIALAAEYEAQAQTVASHSANASISLTRQEVLNRANLMATYRWTLSAANTSTKANVTLPDFVIEAKSTGNLENGGTVQITGIPYCWGGFDSQYTSNSGYSTFDQAIAAEHIAGNVSSANGNKKVPGTAGLDCSGFVSAAYGLSTKKGTGDLLDFGTAIDISAIDTMDFLVKSGHTLLFYNWQSSDKSRMLIIESINGLTNYDDKVIVRVVNTNDYLGYSIRTPW